KHLEDPLAEEILNNKPEEGDVLVADFNKTAGKIEIVIKKEKDSKVSKED
ncbi:MAG: hypothetical protein ISR01_00735, partial [Chitinophagales bacterium]|nr:hypothetical protein [Chitinophagales bacterium]